VAEINISQFRLDVHTENILIRTHWRHPVFSWKDVGVFWTRVLSLDEIKSGNFPSICISNIN